MDDYVNMVDETVLPDGISSQRRPYDGPNTFFGRVYAAVALIPRGKVVSYGHIAKTLGKPRAAREVGWAMRVCPEGLPWHRVVMADGSVTGGVYAELRRALLIDDGVTFLPDGRVDMKLCGWDLGGL